MVGVSYVLINCAGISPPLSLPLDVLRCNFLGTRHLTERVVANHLTDGGAVTTVTSVGTDYSWSGTLGPNRQVLLQPSNSQGEMSA